MDGPPLKVKSFEISKRLVFQASEKVQANQGAPGVDAVSIAEFGSAQRDNLYRLWNRMSSGSIFPDRCGRWRYRRIMVGRQDARCAERRGPGRSNRGGDAAGSDVEPIFHPDSYGYRPGRSALDAVAVARRAMLEEGLGARS